MRPKFPMPPEPGLAAVALRLSLRQLATVIALMKVILIVLASSQARASTPRMPAHCPPERAVYEAVLVAPNSQPDELRFRYDLPTPLAVVPHVVLRSLQRDLELTLEPGMTNSSAVIFVSGGIPFEKLPSYMQEQQRGLHEYWLKNPDAYRRAFHGREYRGHAEEPLSLSSIAISIYSDFEVGSLPLENGQAPVVVVFPDFRRLAHISTFETVGHGVAGGTFRFARCEAKRD